VEVVAQETCQLEDRMLAGRPLSSTLAASSTSPRRKFGIASEAARDKSLARAPGARRRVTGAATIATLI
jgi:hypothetical protein